MTKVKIGNVTLTNRETDCLAARMLGLTINQTAKKLALSPRTVEGYRNTLRLKFKDMVWSEIFIFAMEHGFPPKKYIKFFKSGGEL